MTKSGLLLLLLCTFCISSLAEEPDTSTQNPALASSTQIPVAPARSEVLWVSTLSDTSVHIAGIESMIKVKVNNYFALNEGNPRQVVLYINDIPMDSIFAQTDHPSDNTFVFELNRNQVLRKFYRLGIRDLPVSIGIGTADGSVISGKYRNFKLSFYNQKEMIAVVIGLFLLSGLLIWLSSASKLIKKRGSDAYSLSRTQLAFWTLIILSSYSFIVLLTANDPDLTPSSLILLGISAGTSLASTLVDQRDLKRQSAVSSVPSKGFFFDILSDGEGVSIHRFQNAVFTLVFGIMYISEAFTTLQVPDFGANALLLMGISAAAYTTLKAQGDPHPVTTQETPKTESIPVNQAPINTPPAGGQTPPVEEDPNNTKETGQ